MESKKDSKKSKKNKKNSKANEKVKENKNKINGPNINLKALKKTYNNQSEKNYFFSKIKKKKKTELCKNFELYHKCYFGNNKIRQKKRPP